VELLRPQDAFFLYTETARVQQHVGGLALLGPREAGPVGLADLEERLSARLPRLPRLGHVLSWPARGLARPAWVPAPELRLANHLRRAELRAPGDQTALREYVSAVMARPLDRSRPLWELHLIDGLPGGRQAYLIKLHHAVADGVGALRVVSLLFDEGSRVFDSLDPTAALPAHRSGRAAAFATASAVQLADPYLALLRWARRARISPRRVRRRAGDVTAGLWELMRRGPANPSPLNGQVGPARRVALVEAPLGGIDELCHLYGASRNDVVLAAVLEGLRPVLTRSGSGDGSVASDGRGPVIASTIRVMIPVSMRTVAQRYQLGSWTAALSADLPVGPMSPGERLMHVRQATSRLKRSHQAAGSAFVMSAVGLWAPPRLHAWAARAAYCSRWFNLVVTNLAGPRQPVHLFGAPVEIAYPIVPLADGIGLTVGAMSWGTQMALSLTADPALVPEVDEVALAVRSWLGREPARWRAPAVSPSGG
jgi:diacylglycerol O-acyltransferase